MLEGWQGRIWTYCLCASFLGPHIPNGTRGRTCMHHPSHMSVPDSEKPPGSVLVLTLGPSPLEGAGMREGAWHRPWRAHTLSCRFSHLLSLVHYSPAGYGNCRAQFADDEMGPAS